MLDQDERLRGLKALAARAEGNAQALAALARLFRTEGDKAQSVELAARAMELAPADSEIHAIAREVLSGDVPSWHFPLIRDAVRNQAYEDALRRAISPDSRVLEIGAGTGILAMMAARLGARHVYSCEMEPAVAHAAQEIVSQNGLSDRITVIPRHSGAIDPADLGGPVDILVSEIVSNDMLNEHVLPVLEDAVGRLVKRGGAVIPASGQVRVALGYHERLESRRLGLVSGFDQSSFNRLAPNSFQVDTSSPHLVLRSDPQDLFKFDFHSGGPWEEMSMRVQADSYGGNVNGIAQWIALDMDACGRYENRPGMATSSCWAVMFHHFSRGLSTDPDQPVGICGRHDRVGLRIWKDDRQ